MLRISVQPFVSCSSVLTTGNASGEDKFFQRGKKEGFTVVVSYGLSVFKLYPIRMKTGVLKLCLFARKFNIH